MIRNIIALSCIIALCLLVGPIVDDIDPLRARMMGVAIGAMSFFPIKDMMKVMVGCHD